MNFIKYPSLIKGKKRPGIYARKIFSVNKSPKNAILKITACGLYKAWINGKPVGNELLTPGFTNYKARLQFQEYDVTDLIENKDNTITISLGNGWYKGKIGGFHKKNVYGKELKLAVQLLINQNDGEKITINSDESWKINANGPSLHNDLMDGESYDARKVFKDWHTVNFSDAHWENAQATSYEGQLVPSEGEIVREHETFLPTILQNKDNTALLDFGQNLVGYVEFTVKGMEGHKVTLRHGESLDENGDFTLKNLTPDGLTGKLFPKLKQSIEYVLCEGEQSFKPSFTFHGFRYLQIENWPEEIKPSNFKAIAVYSDLKSLGNFKCSNEKINQLVKNTQWSMKGNFIDIPTDCPTRERAGWAGDIALFCKTGSYLSDTNKFLEKWLADLALQQKPNGKVPNVIPDAGYPSYLDGSAGWGDAAVIIPHTLYEMFRNKNVLENQYASMVKWVEFAEQRAAKRTSFKYWSNPHKKYLVDTGYHWGEWLEPWRTLNETVINNFLIPDAEVATAYLAFSSGLLSEIATILGKDDDAEKFLALSNNVKLAYRETFTNDGLVESKRQCKFVRPIALNLLPEEDKIQNAEKLNELVKNNDYKIGTGFLTTPFILPVLCDFGFTETAYKLAENEGRPGWLYAINKGATTIWENWNGIDEDNFPIDSHNHYAFGSVVQWYFTHVAGITPATPGFQTIRIQPYPGGSLKHAQANYQTQNGLVSSSWEVSNGNFTLNIETPVETHVVLPNKDTFEVSAGKHSFNCPLNEIGLTS